MVTVAQAERVHAGALAELAGEMVRFYGASEVAPLDVRIRAVSESLFGDPPLAYCLLAWDDGRLVGFAAYSFHWPAVGLTRSLYLKDLFVTGTARGKGVGRLLIRHLHDVAVRNGCTRVEWTTDQDNLEAQRLYARLGVPVRTSKLFYRVEAAEVQRLAGLE